MKPLLILLLISTNLKVIAQKATKDTSEQKDPIAVAEVGGAASLGLKGGKSSVGYDLAVEVTPIEDWLELELGVTPTFGDHLKETEVDFLIKKPWTLAPKVEFMFGVGLAWSHYTENNISGNSTAGELALDFMFWSFKTRRFGLYLEPAYEYGFDQQHEQSIGISAGLLISIR